MERCMECWADLDEIGECPTCGSTSRCPACLAAHAPQCEEDEADDWARDRAELDADVEADQWREEGGRRG